MIIVLTTPRSGSTFRCNTLAKQYNYEFLGEADHPSSESLSKVKNQIKNFNDNTLVKVFAIERKLNLRVMNLYTNLASKVFIHGRKNFNEQCRSLYISRTTKVWSADPLDVRHIKYDPLMYNFCSQQLINGYLQIACMKKNLKNFEISFLEDLEDFSLEKKYKQPVVWDQEPPHINFNTEEALYG